MELKKDDIIFMDTAPLIYFWEQNPEYTPAISRLFDKIYAANAILNFSLITYIEIMTWPLKEQKFKLAAKYRDYFTNSANLTLYPVNLLVAEKTAEYRAEYNLKTPDAIQLATAEICGADYVITNDSEWNKVEQLNIVQVSDL